MGCSDGDRWSVISKDGMGMAVVAKDFLFVIGTTKIACRESVYDQHNLKVFYLPIRAGQAVVGKILCCGLKSICMRTVHLSWSLDTYLARSRYTIRSTV